MKTLILSLLVFCCTFLGGVAGYCLALDLWSEILQGCIAKSADPSLYLEKDWAQSLLLANNNLKNALINVIIGLGSFSILLSALLTFIERKEKAS